MLTPTVLLVPAPSTAESLTSPAARRGKGGPLILACATLLLGACGPGDDQPASAPERVVADDQVAIDGQAPSDHLRLTLRLDQRAGTSELGWSFEEQSLVPAEQAQLAISSWDCGARGRWVMLEGNGVTLCHLVEPDADGVAEACTPWEGLEIGGSHPGIELGAVIRVLHDGIGVADLRLVERSPTPERWYEAEPIAPYEVVFEVERTEPVARCSAGGIAP